MDPKLKDETEDRSQDQATNPNMEGSASLSKRIANSASGMLQNVFASPSASAIAETLGSLNADTSKSGASSSASTGDGSSSSQAVLRQETSLGRGQSMVGESFRSIQDRDGRRADRGQQEFDEFAQTSRLQGFDNTITQSLGLGNFERPTMVGDHCPCVFCNMGKLHPNRKTYGPDVEPATSSNDGAAVVALLSDPTFDVGEEPTDTWAVSTTEKGKSKLRSQPVESQLYGWADPLAPVNPLDLLPNFNTSDTSLGPAFGDLQPWTDMLNRYHDEVWGDMLPLVKEAREELKSATSSPGGTSHDRPALRRLGMLLKHLHQPML